MNLYTMGFTQKSAEKFFSLIEKNNIEILIDIRLRNNSQLAGFAKGRDLKYFLRKLDSCLYVHEEKFAPYKEMLDDYKKGIISWEKYEILYRELYERRGMGEYFFKRFNTYENVLFLCSEVTPEHCHRRLLAEYLAYDNSNVVIYHL